MLLAIPSLHTIPIPIPTTWKHQPISPIPYRFFSAYYTRSATTTTPNPFQIFSASPTLPVRSATMRRSQHRRSIKRLLFPFINPLAVPFISTTTTQCSQYGSTHPHAPPATAFSLPIRILLCMLHLMPTRPAINNLDVPNTEATLPPSLPPSPSHLSPSRAKLPHPTPPPTLPHYTTASVNHADILAYLTSYIASFPDSRSSTARNYKPALLLDFPFPCPFLMWGFNSYTQRSI